MRYQHKCNIIYFSLSLKLTGLLVFCMQGTFVEGIKEEVVLSPAHALSLIAAGEGEAS